MLKDRLYPIKIMSQNLKNLKISKSQNLNLVFIENSHLLDYSFNIIIIYIL